MWWKNIQSQVYINNATCCALAQETAFDGFIGYKHMQNGYCRYNCTKDIGKENTHRYKANLCVWNIWLDIPWRMATHSFSQDFLKSRIHYALQQCLKGISIMFFDIFGYGHPHSPNVFSRVLCHQRYSRKQDN